MMYSITEIKEMQEEARSLNLNVDPAFLNWKWGKLRQVCNGVGAESWPEELREKLSIIFDDYRTAYADHDVGYATHRHTKAVVDRRMRDNSLRLWKNKWGFWRFVRPKARAERVLLLAAYAAVKVGGLKAWEAAVKCKKD